MKEKLNNKRRKQIGLLLQHERKCLKLKQNIIAQKMDARHEYISKIEAGLRRIDILELIEYAEVLGFSITEIAWKIETFLSGLRLLPLPKVNVLGKKIRVDVSWCKNNFMASVGGFLPEKVVFTANTFDNLKTEVEKGLDSQFRELETGGVDVPQWLKNKAYEFEYIFLDARSLLNAYSPYVSLAVISRVSRINQNLLSQYANGYKKARPNQLKRIAEAIQKISKKMAVIVP